MLSIWTIPSLYDHFATSVTFVHFEQTGRWLMRQLAIMSNTPSGGMTVNLSTHKKCTWQQEWKIDLVKYESTHFLDQAWPCLGLRQPKEPHHIELF